MDRSLAGKLAKVAYVWTCWYIKRRKILQIIAEHLHHEALREQGTYTGVTQTKIRRAASRLVASGVAK